MKTFKPSPGVYIAINARLAYAVFLIAVAYAIWPTSMKWYGFGLLSIMAGLAGAVLAVNALRQIKRVREFETEQREFQALGKDVKSSSQPSEDFLTEKGVMKNVD